MTFKLTPIAISLVLSLGLFGCNNDNNNQTQAEVTLPATPIIDMGVLNYIDPMIGTAASGHTFPGAVVPRGMVQLSPDTFKGTNTDTETGQNPWHSASGYWDASDYVAGDVLATDLNIYGFSHTHLSGTGATDLGDILVLPYSDDANRENNAFDKATETASPGYYSVVLNNGNIKAELSTTTRVGVHRYT